MFWSCLSTVPAVTLDGTRRAERRGTHRLSGGREIRQKWDESVRGQRARRIPGRIRPGPEQMVQGDAESRLRVGAAAAVAAARRDRRAHGMRGRLEVTLVRVLDVEALA